MWLTGNGRIRVAAKWIACARPTCIREALKRQQKRLRNLHSSEAAEISRLSKCAEAVLASAPCMAATVRHCGPERRSLGRPSGDVSIVGKCNHGCHSFHWSRRPRGLCFLLYIRHSIPLTSTGRSRFSIRSNVWFNAFCGGYRLDHAGGTAYVSSAIVRLVPPTRFIVIESTFDTFTHRTRPQSHPISSETCLWPLRSFVTCHSSLRPSFLSRTRKVLPSSLFLSPSSSPLKPCTLCNLRSHTDFHPCPSLSSYERLS